jgi:DNA-binding GntR family transcriptional regulator
LIKQAMAQPDIKALLLDDIVQGRLRPGAKLTIDELARRYGTSHMPVRQVLREMHGAGLLTQGAGRSMHIATLDRTAVDNLFSTRSAIEVLLARQAAQRCTKADLERLEALERELEARVAAGQHAEVLAANQHFHAALYALAGNDDAAWLVVRSWLFSNTLWARVGFGPERYAGMVSDHRHILTAMRAGDIEGVGVLMGAHVLKAKYELFRRLFDEA